MPYQRKADAGPSRSAAIDGLRAVAVLLVLTAHTLGQGPPILVAIGDHGVDMFFVVSGLCLSLGLARERAPRVLPFIVARFARIAPPYYVAIAVFGALALTPFGYPTALPEAMLSPGAGAHELIMDTLFSGSHAPIHNTSFWTLGIEMRWYVLCVPLLSLWRRSRPIFFAVAVICYLAYWWTPFGFVDEGILPAFMLGIVAGAIERVPPRACIVLAIATSVSIAATIAHDWHSTTVDHMSPAWHLCAFGLVVCARQAPFSSAFAWRPLATIGTASYSIYLVHQPIVAELEHLRVPAFLAALAGLAGGFAFWAAIELPLTRPDRRQRFVDRTLRFVRRPVLTDATAAGPARVTG